MFKRSIKYMLVLAMLGSSALTVHAGDGERREHGDRYYGNGGGNGGGDMREQRQIARQERQRDVRAVQQMQPQPEQRGEPQPDRRGSRMSPEDRRALRRQIDQASHDIYAPNR